MSKKAPFYKMRGHTLPGPNQRSPIELDAEDLPDVTIGLGGTSSQLQDVLQRWADLEALKKTKKKKMAKEQSWTVGQSPIDSKLKK